MGCPAISLRELRPTRPSKPHARVFSTSRPPGFFAQQLKDELAGERLAKEVAVRAAVEAEATLARGFDTQRLGSSAPKGEKLEEPTERALARAERSKAALGFEAARDPQSAAQVASPSGGSGALALQHPVRLLLGQAVKVVADRNGGHDG